MPPQNDAPRKNLPWRAWLIYTHRWLGIAGSLLFIAWFISGIVMMYWRMPTVTPEERAMHAEPLNVSALRVSPSEAANKAGAKSAANIELAMWHGRPVYRVGGRTPRTVFADSGTTLDSVTVADAILTAKQWAPNSSENAREVELITNPDQWTLQYRPHLPIHRIDLGDADDTRLYVSGTTGQVVVDATRAERFWGYLGPVMHWLYLPVLRRNGPAWTQVILWTSGIGCIMCIAGLWVGLMRYSPRSRFRQRQGGSMSPYDGLLKWHHYAGLVFGLVTLTWTFSGLMSMGPFSWLDAGPQPSELRTVLAGKAPAFDSITPAQVQTATAAVSTVFPAKELTLSAFRNEPYWMSDEPPASEIHRGRSRIQQQPRIHRNVAALHPESGAFASFEHKEIEEIAKAAMPGIGMVEAGWMNEYDGYYIHRASDRSLPVYRVRYADENDTWIYYDPQRGTAPLVSRPKERLERWLYEGLHSLSFPLIFFQRPLWDVIMLVLLIGGTALGILTLVPGWQRLVRRTKGVLQRRNSAVES